MTPAAEAFSGRKTAAAYRAVFRRHQVLGINLICWERTLGEIPKTFGNDPNCDGKDVERNLPQGHDKFWEELHVAGADQERLLTAMENVKKNPGSQLADRRIRAVFNPQPFHSMVAPNATKYSPHRRKGNA